MTGQVLLLPCRPNASGQLLSQPLQSKSLWAKCRYNLFRPNASGQQLSQPLQCTPLKAKYRHNQPFRQVTVGHVLPNPVT